jgi:arylsulfatase A-like enzyme
VVDIIAFNVSARGVGLGARALHALWDAALLVALGAFSDLVVAALERTVGRRSRAALWAALFVLGALGMRWSVDRIFSRQADAAFGGELRWLLYPSFIAGAGLGIVIALALGRRLATTRWLWVAAVVASLVALVVNELLFRDDYIEIHTAVVWSAATLSGASASRALASRVEKASRRVVVGLRVTAALLLVLAAVPAPNSVRLDLFRSPGGVGAWVFASFVWTLPSFDAAPTPEVAPVWLSARADSPPRSPSEVSIAKAPPVVVLLTIDAVRADTVLSPANAEHFPTLRRLMREGVTFSRARAPGSQTAVSLTGLFSGKTFSELKWEKYGAGTSRFEYAVNDPTPRFVSALADAGVSTFKVASLTFLRNEYAVAPGFAEEVVVTSGRKHAPGPAVVQPILDRLRTVGDDEPLFVFAHLTEPHAPYDRGKLKKGTPYERYVSEIALADTYVARIVKALSAPRLAQRSLLIVSSDHGEAFGEHGTWEHTKTIYEELVRVPLIAWGGWVSRGELVSQPVSLFDLGPTILDVFGLPTPDHHVGQSLVPILAGQPLTLERPILVEGRLRRALYTGDLKVMVDLRRKTVEAYDLAVDPGELHNLYDRDRGRVAPALAALRAYYEARGYTADGYEPIYKP